MMAEKENIQLFVKASDDGESLGNCPFCQRLFMILMQKGVPFTLTTVDMKRAPEVLKDLAPGSQPPFLLYNGEVKTDTNKIEEFLEEKLKPPSYPNMSPRYKDSSTAGDDIFQKFSAYIKNCNPQREDATTSVVPKKNRLSHGWWVYRHQPGMQQTGIPFGLPKTEKTLALQKNLLKSLLKLDRYLLKPQEHELSAQPGLTVSCRKFLDGDTLTLPDCSLLPKLHIVNTVCKHFRHFEIPKDLQAITRYMSNARELKEFKYTCPNTEEILLMYRPVVQPMP